MFKSFLLLFSFVLCCNVESAPTAFEKETHASGAVRAVRLAFLSSQNMVPLKTADAGNNMPCGNACEQEAAAILAGLVKYTGPSVAAAAPTYDWRATAGADPSTIHTGTSADMAAIPQPPVLPQPPVRPLSSVAQEVREATKELSKKEGRRLKSRESSRKLRQNISVYCDHLKQFIGTNLIVRSRYEALMNTPERLSQLAEIEAEYASIKRRRNDPSLPKPQRRQKLNALSAAKFRLQENLRAVRELCLDLIEEGVIPALALDK